MKKLNRRSFLKSSLLTTGSLSLLPSSAAKAATVTASASATVRVAGANSDIRFAVVGFGGRGMAHIEGLSAVKGTRLVALCDVDSKILDREVAKCRAAG